MNAITMEEARDIIIKNIMVQQKTKSCSIFQAAGQVVSRQYIADMNQPPFDRSPLDGFALHHEDIAKATENMPVTLEISHKIFAGDDFRVEIKRGQAARIMTGAGIPSGADCVIRQEDCVFDEKQVTITSSLKAHDNICDMGEDMAIGDVIIRQGQVITPAFGAVLAGQGYFEVEVYEPLRIGVLATGSELTQERPKPGQIYNSNAPMIAIRLGQFGMLPVCHYCSDEVSVITKEIEKMLTECDIVITTGGVSVGDKDYLPEVVEELKGEVLFHGIAMKPGSPMMAAKVQDKMLLCLSGNPFAALTTLELIAMPGLLKASGRSAYYPLVISARLADAFPKNSKKGRRFIRAFYHKNQVGVPKNHSSGSITSMIGCNCFIDIVSGSDELQVGQWEKCVMLLSDENAQSTESENMQSKVPVVCICGSKNVGKTTVMEQIVRMLTDKGYHIGVIKHDGHDFVPDVPGTDSFRAGQAGACSVAVYSDKRMMMHQCFENETESMNIQDLIEGVVELSRQKLDLILVEGLKDSSYPKIEVVRGQIAKNCVSAKPRIAVCTDVEVGDLLQNECDCPVFELEQISQIAELLEEYINTKG